MTTKTLLLALVLSVCFQAVASQDYYVLLPPKAGGYTYSEECDYRDKHNLWVRNYPTRADYPGLWLPNLMMFDTSKEFGAMTAYLVICWFVWPFASLLLLACGGKTAKLIGLAMLVPWVWFSMNRYVEFFTVWLVLPSWIIGSLIRNIKKSVFG